MQKILPLLMLGVLWGCTHAQVQPTLAQVKPAVVQPMSKERQELEALLRKTVIHFNFNEDLLSQDSQGHLQKVATVMKKHKALNIKIAGNCDERGTEEYNLALGQRRADVAKKYIVSLGVSDRQVDTVSYGKEKPADPGHDEDAWAQNRRDEFQPQ